MQAPEKPLLLSHLIKSGQILASCLYISKQMFKSGFTALQVDAEMEKFILLNDALPSFKNLNGYPFTSCISFNEQVVHSIPRERKMEPDDIITVDIGVSFCGHCTDAARTFIFRKNDKKHKLVLTAYEALDAGISKSIENNTVGDISYSIQRVIELNRYRTPTEIGGHGIGLEPHTNPFIPNCGVAGRGPKLEYGMVLAIEPIVMVKSNKLVLEDDGFTLKSKNGLLSSHVEDTIVVTDKEPLILTRKTLDGNIV